MFRRRVWAGLTIALVLITTVAVGNTLVSRYPVAADSPRGVVAPGGRAFTEIPSLPSPNAVYDTVNTVRLQHGLQPLQRNDALAALAQERAEDMAVNRYYAHRGPDGLAFDQLLQQDGYDIDYGCENLDLDFTLTASTYVNAWLASHAGHRECLLNPTVTDAGYAVSVIANNSPTDIKSYVVVAIHATAPIRK